MTKQECAIIQAYTGEKMLSDNDMVIFYDYIAHLLEKHDVKFERSSIPKICDNMSRNDGGNVIRILAEEDFKTLCSMAFDIDDLFEEMSGVLEKDDECGKCCEHVEDKNDEYQETIDQLLDDFKRIDDALVAMESYLRDFIMVVKGVK